MEGIIALCIPIVGMTIVFLIIRTILKYRFKSKLLTHSDVLNKMDIDKLLDDNPKLQKINLLKWIIVSFMVGSGSIILGQIGYYNIGPTQIGFILIWVSLGLAIYAYASNQMIKKWKSSEYDD